MNSCPRCDDCVLLLTGLRELPPHVTARFPRVVVSKSLQTAQVSKVDCLVKPELSRFVVVWERGLPFQGLLFWLFKGAFKVSSGTVERYRSSYGTDFDSCVLLLCAALPFLVLGAMRLVVGWSKPGPNPDTSCLWKCLPWMNRALFRKKRTDRRKGSLIPLHYILHTMDAPFLPSRISTRA